MTDGIGIDMRFLSTLVFNSLLLVILLVTSPISSGREQASPPQASATSSGQIDDTSPQVRNSGGRPVKATAVDRLYERTSGLIQGTTGYFDNFFFADTGDASTGSDTRVRLRLNTGYIEGHGWDFDPNLRLNLGLPFLNDKVRFVVNEDTDEDQGASSADSAETSDLALRWVELDGDTLGLSFDLGMRLSGVGYPESNTEPAGFGRVNSSLRFAFGDWNLRTNNRLYYYSNTGFRNDFRQYFDRPFNENLMFRSRTRIQYFEEYGYNPEWEQKFSIFHKLNEKSAIAYEALASKRAIEASYFETDEITVGLKESYYEGQIRIRYRRNVWRPWLFMELWPVLLFPEEKDYKTTPAVRFRMEINFGALSAIAGQIDE